MNRRNYLAVDLGAESGRLIVGTITDDNLNLIETHRFINQPLNFPDGLHWDVDRLWNEIKTGITASAREFHLDSLALDAWGVDFALLDRNSKLMENPYHYRDKRTDGMFAQAFRQISREQIFAQTGIQFMQINTLYQLLSMVISKNPRLVAARSFLTIPDLFNFWLCGKISCEFTNATTTQCFNPLTHSWAYPLLEALAIPTGIFPALCEPGTILGTLQSTIAGNSIAKAVPVIAPACHDTGSAVVAVPAGGVDFAWLSSGTWSILGAEVTAPVLSEQALKYNFTNEGGVYCTWRLSKNIMGLWLVQECKRQWGFSYDEITRMAAEAQPFLAVIDPDNTNFLHPGNMPEKIRAFCQKSGQAVPQTPGEVVRLTLESLALKYRLVLSRLEELIGKRLEPIHIIGGGAKNSLLNQLTADCTGRTVVAGPSEATAIGNILVQALALGHIESLSLARALVRRSFALKIYQPIRDDGWDEGLAKLQTLINSDLP